MPVVDVERETYSLGGGGQRGRTTWPRSGAAPLLVGVVGDDADRRAAARRAGARAGSTRRRLVADRDAAAPRSRRASSPTSSRSCAPTRRTPRRRGGRRSRRRARPRGRARCCRRRTAMIVSDYGKGVDHRAGCSSAAARRRAPRPACRVSVDPKETHFFAYRGATVLTPNQHEAGARSAGASATRRALLAAGWGLRERLDAERVLITRGADGMSLFERGGRYTHLPTVAREVYDVTGAGDTVVSVFALALAAGADSPQAACLANHAAGLVIRQPAPRVHAASSSSPRSAERARGSRAVAGSLTPRARPRRAASRPGAPRARASCSPTACSTCCIAATSSRWRGARARRRAGRRRQLRRLGAAAQGPAPAARAARGPHGGARRAARRGPVGACSTRTRPRS